MSRFVKALTAGLISSALPLVACDPILAQGCGQRGPAPGSGTGSQQISPLQGGSIANLQQAQLQSQLAALQQQQAFQVQQTLAANAARRQAEAAAQAEKRERELNDRAAQFRQLGDRFRAEDRIALAIQNYRRAVAARPASSAGLAALAELDAYQDAADNELSEVQQLITQGDLEQASTRLSELKRDYGKLKAGQRIASMAGRVERLKSQAVGTELVSRIRLAKPEAN
jgi:hypothetical protein